MYDEEVPQAYEQVSDGKQTMANKVGDFMDNNHIMYTSPTLDLMGASITAHLGYSPQASDAAVGDGGQATYSATVGSGKEAGITIAYEGLKLGFYGAERERTNTSKQHRSVVLSLMSSTVHGTLNTQWDQYQLVTLSLTWTQV